MLLANQIFVPVQTVEAMVFHTEYALSAVITMVAR